MIAISFTFPAKRFHATPWGRQVNEGAVEWPPSPWRVLRSLVAVWHHKFPDMPEADVRELIEKLTPPPGFCLPPASQGHTRHYMPLVSGEKTKVFDTFVAVEPDDAVIAVWPDIEATATQRKMLAKLLAAMTYFGRAESWVCGDLLDDLPRQPEVAPIELGQEPPHDFELVRTLAPVSAEEHVAWHSHTYQQQSQRKLDELIAAAKAKGRPADRVKLSPKDELALDELLPKTLFDALHADTAELRKAGWNQPPGSRWINYARPVDAFSRKPQTRRSMRRESVRPTVVRFALCGPVRPLLTEAVLIGERARTILMGCSKKVRQNGNSATVFSGKEAGGSRLDAGHRHAHFLCEAADRDGRISHLTIFAPMGFDSTDELAFGRLAQAGIWGKDGYDLQVVLLGIGQPQDFGGVNEKAGQSRSLATSKVWVSRTPLVLNRHLKTKPTQFADRGSLDQAIKAELREYVRLELGRRPQFADMAPRVEIEPLFDRGQTGTQLGGHFTSWLKFRRERRSGSGAMAGSQGYGFRLTFPVPVSGPISLGYGCHFGLGLFSAK